MEIFSFIKDIFKPASDIVDELHFSGEEAGNLEVKKAELKNKLAEIQAQMSTKVIEFQGKLTEANSKIAVAEQQHGNWLSKSWRPLASIMFIINISLMIYGVVPINEIALGGMLAFLGVYTGGRSLEKKK